MSAPSLPARRRAASVVMVAAAALAVISTLLTNATEPALAQSPPAPPVNGMRPADVRTFAITDATVITSPGQKLDHATIIIRKGVIESVGVNIAVPPDARVWPGAGLTVYPGFIDAAVLVNVDLPAASRSSGAYWNARIHPELNISQSPGPDKSLRKDLRAIGFAAAAVYPANGALRGSGAVLALADEDENMLAYKPRALMAAGFDYGSGGAAGGGGPGRRGAAGGEGAGYPGSLIGAVALLRQAFCDAQWNAACRRVYAEHPQGNEPPQRNDALVALDDVMARRQSILFESSDEANALRAARIASEFNLDLTILGSGTEFRQLDEVKALKLPFIVPLDFPKRPDVATLSAADNVSLRDLMTWEQAPTNPRRMLAAGLTVALTTHKLKSRGDFLENLRTAVKHGLTEDQALAAITTTPAAMLGLDKVLGTIEPGKAANLVVVKGSIFDKKAKLRDTWVNGRRYELFKDPAIKVTGSGTLKTALNDSIAIDIDTVKSTVTLKPTEKESISAKKVVVQQDEISFVVDGKPFGVDGYVRLQGIVDSGAAPADAAAPQGSPATATITGNGLLPSGAPFTFTIEVTLRPEDAAANDDPNDAASSEKKQPGKAGNAGEADKPDEKQPPADADADDSDEPGDPITGKWTFTIDGTDLKLPLEFILKPGNIAHIIGVSSTGEKLEADGTFDPVAKRVAYVLNSTEMGAMDISVTFAGDALTGTVRTADFNATFTGTREAPAGGDSDKPGRGGSGKGAGRKSAPKEPPFVMPPDEMNYPLGEYGRTSPPIQRDVLITNATIWTCGPQGKIQRGWLLVRDGKIDSLGSGAPLARPAAKAGAQPVVIDAQGLHVTPGLIDCHSHTGVDGSVNEFAQTNTAEVRIADGIDPTDINWYRELAGGLIAANQLHGSANPIGGQNSVVKIKFGAAGGAAAFPVRDAVGGIKFALGENVKRSESRYPNTRMGVEAFIRDAFTGAREYKAAWDRYAKLPADKKAATYPPRLDLETETLVEILEGKRIVHCHSYRQDEILMLIRVADAFGFHIGTFQHVLEGYKVADAIARHGAGASSFSDWWAYKIEVIDAIPYNGALMHNAGVVVSFNSDSDELARRMNTEAAKAVRYGGLSPEEALKFVTINPARQLRIDHRTGSLEPGKDADFVIWSGDPLSTYTRCEQTWIEGACYFSLNEDQQLRETTRRERQRIIQKVLVQTHGEPSKPGDDAASQPSSAPTSGPSSGPAESRPKPMMLRMLEAKRREMEERVRLGEDPEQVRPADCGCNDIWSALLMTSEN